MPTLSFFPPLYDIIPASPNESFAAVPPDFGALEPLPSMPAITWNVIGKNWQNTRAIVSHEDRLFVFCNGLYEVDSADQCQKVSEKWDNVIAATELGGEAFVVTCNGELWRINLSTFEHQKVSSNLVNTKILITYNDHVLVFSGDLWKFYPDGRSERISSDWSSTLSATVIGNHAYLVTLAGELWRINLNDYVSEKISINWENTTEIVAYCGDLFIFCADILFRLDAQGNPEIIGDGWECTLAATVANDALYVAKNSGDLFKINVD